MGRRFRHSGNLIAKTSLQQLGHQRVGAAKGAQLQGFCDCAANRREGCWSQAMRVILVIIIVLLLFAALPTWPYSAGWGYYPSGGLGLLLLILIVLVLLGYV
jgi:uncharacterized protein DUF3309